MKLDGMSDEKKPQPLNQDRLVERLDHMVEIGRVTEVEAARVRAASGADELDQAVRAIRLRHAGDRLDAAVAAGHMTRSQADTHLEGLANGDHPGDLRSLLHG